MSPTRLPAKRFRIERLEERITPSMMFWASDPGVNALTQWAIIEASDSPQSTAQNSSPQRATHHETRCVESTQKRSHFPAWAERILQEIEAELSHQPQPGHVPSGITDDVTFFSDVMNTARQTDAKNDVHFPVWAQELLADLDQRPSHEASAPSATENGESRSQIPHNESTLFVQPKCESTRFPAWAEQLLSAVDRRIEYESRNEFGGRNNASQSPCLDEVISRRVSSA